MGLKALSKEHFLYRAIQTFLWCVLPSSILKPNPCWVFSGFLGMIWWVCFEGDIGIL